MLVQHRSTGEPDLMGEFKALAWTAEYMVVGEFNIVGPMSARFGIRSGKVEEIKIWIEINKPDVVIYSPRLKSSQMFRLMEEWKTEVRDRTQLILEIFDKHARTVQAKLQIEQARLSYEIPFVRHQLRTRMQKEHSGAKPVGEQTGAGEDLLNLRIMELRHRVAMIDDKLDKISESQTLKRKKRVDAGFSEVALAGYTNAGKSTLHHALTGSDVEVADQLFTTLSTKSSELTMAGRRVVLTDSVGFISDLPRSLLRAFNTTLMEIAEADVIILVADGSDSLQEVKRKVDVCLDTFSQIGVNSVPIVTALNKIDLLSVAEVEARVSMLRNLGARVVPVSARDGLNVTELVEAVEGLLPGLSTYSITLPYGDSTMSMVSGIHEAGHVESQSYREDGVEIEASLTLDAAQKLFKMLPRGSLRRIESAPPDADKPGETS